MMKMLPNLDRMRIFPLALQASGRNHLKKAVCAIYTDISEFIVDMNWPNDSVSDEHCLLRYPLDHNILVKASKIIGKLSICGCHDDCKLLQYLGTRMLNDGARSIGLFTSKAIFSSHWKFVAQKTSLPKCTVLPSISKDTDGIIHARVDEPDMLKWRSVASMQCDWSNFDSTVVPFAMSSWSAAMRK